MPAADSLEASGANPTLSTNGSNKRKRGAGAAAGAAAGTSSRGVANLTPEQLERKRANDREAQRAIRERTKQQIDRLNSRIRELESSQPYQQLQDALDQRAAVQAENDDIKRQLASFIAIFQRHVASPQSLEDLAAAAERNAIPYPPADQPHILSQHDPHQYPPPPAVDNASPHATAGVASPASQPSMSRPFQYPRAWPATSGTALEPHPRNIHPDLAYNHGDERLGVEFLLDSNQRITKGLNGVSPPSQPPAADTPGPHSALPRTSSATCPLDAILLDAFTERQRATASGVPVEEVAGPVYPNFNALLNKHTSHSSHPISKVFTDILRTFPDLATLPEQVAVVYVLFLVMRWQVDPSKENYERMPEWVRPLPSQLFTPHPPWLDYIPWPRLRDQVCQNPPHFDTFFVPYTTTLALNWPYAPSDILLPSSAPTHHVSAASPASTSSSNPDPNEPVWRMNPAFETHLRDLGNWSLGPLFRDTFPQWADAVRIKER